MTDFDRLADETADGRLEPGVIRQAIADLEAERIGDIVERQLGFVLREAGLSDELDASGCDSGDPADYIASQASKALVRAIDERDEAMRQVAALREALAYARRDGEFRSATAVDAILAALADTAASATAHDERIRAAERERCARVVLDEVDGADEERARDSALSRLADRIRATGAEGRTT